MLLSRDDTRRISSADMANCMCSGAARGVAVGLPAQAAVRDHPFRKHGAPPLCPCQPWYAQSAQIHPDMCSRLTVCRLSCPCELPCRRQCHWARLWVACSWRCHPAGRAPALPPEMHDMNPLYAATKRHMSPQVSLGPRPPSSGWQVCSALPHSSQSMEGLPQHAGQLHVGI
jgi:hypothetical protein